jgi:hypothetical protein
MLSNTNIRLFTKANAMQQPEQKSALHTTLPMEDLIGLLAGEIRDLIEYDSFEFEDRQNSKHIFIGVPKLHKCHYRIRFAGSDCGQITLTRSQPFADKDLMIIEGALAALSIHLSNAHAFQTELTEGALEGLKADRNHSSAA